MYGGQCLYDVTKWLRKTFLIGENAVFIGEIWKKGEKGLERLLRGL
jgi:hypothetical protein